MKKILGLTLLVAGLLFAGGCGGPARTTVKGKVTVAGKGPLPGGNITFALASDEKINGGGLINADGSYEVVTAPIGECKVLIDNSHLDTASKTKGLPVVPGGPGMPGGTSKAPKDTEGKMGSAPTGVDATPGSGPGKLSYIRIDSSYSKFSSTPLKTTVTNGKATPSDFEVK